jgi:hypothetical protein
LTAMLIPGASSSPTESVRIQFKDELVTKVMEASAQNCGMAAADQLLKHFARVKFAMVTE